MRPRGDPPGGTKSTTHPAARPSSAPCAGPRTTAEEATTRTTRSGRKRRRHTEARQHRRDGEGGDQDGAGAEQPEQAQARDHDGAFAAAPPSVVARCGGQDDRHDVEAACVDGRAHDRRGGELTLGGVDRDDGADDDPWDVGAPADAAEGRDPVAGGHGRAVDQAQGEVAGSADGVAGSGRADAAQHPVTHPDGDGRLGAVEKADVAGPRSDGDDAADQSVGGHDGEVRFDAVAIADVQRHLAATGDGRVGADDPGREQTAGPGRRRREQPAGGVVLREARLGLGQPSAEDRVLLLEGGAVTVVDGGHRPLDGSDRGGRERTGAVGQRRTGEVEDDGDDGDEQQDDEEAPAPDGGHRRVTGTRW